MSPTPIRQVRTQLVLGVAAVLVMVWAGVAHQLGSERGEAVRVATQQGQNLARAVADQFSSYAGTVDRLLRRLRIHWIRDPVRFAEAVALEQDLRKNALQARISVIDAHGWLAYASPAQKRVFLGDREYFKAHRNRPADELRIGNPARDDASGEILIRFTRPILDKRGGFSGVLAISVSPDVFTRFYKGLELGPASLVGIMRLDNTLLLRWPDIGSSGRRVLDLPAGAAGAASSGSYIRQSGIDGVERLYSYRKFTDLPLIAGVGQGFDAVLADYRAERLLYLATGGLVSLAILGLGLLLLSKLRREEHVESALSQSEARFRSLTQLASDMYWEQDAEYRFVSASRGGPGWSIKGRSEAIGKRRWDFPYVNMTEADWARHIAALDARQPFQDLELCGLRSGRKVWVSVSGEPIFDASGAFTGYRGIGKDITARKRSEQLQTLEHVVNRSLAEASDTSSAVQSAIRAICENEGWECGRYFGWDERDGLLRLASSWSAPGAAMEQFIENSRGLTYAPGVGLAGIVWQTGRPLWVPDIAADPRVSRAGFAGDTGMRGAFVFPVIADGKPIGVLAFNSREVREPEERLLQAILVIGSQIGQFLRRRQGEDE